jgi:uncharacterized membrane protein
LAEEKAMRGEFTRGSEEFSRVLAFSDGLFAIAMTLLVVGIAVPDLAHGGDESELLHALRDIEDQILSFFISFIVIGRYWVAHHQFFRLLRAMDYRLITINLTYLALIAFLPFPTALLGDYFENPISVATYAVTVAFISGLEVAMFRRAHRRGLLVRTMPEAVFRWGATAATLPVVFLLASVPVAFLDTKVAVACWFLQAPGQVILSRNRPPEADQWFGAR